MPKQSSVPCDPDTRLANQLTRIQDAAAKRHGTAESGGQVTSTEQRAPEVSARPKRGRAGRTMIEAAQMELLAMEQTGRFSQRSLRPENEYPALLTRLPIFVPGKRSNQRDRLDADNALPFSTSWGSGRKHGPPVTVYDEDTLIALLHLRKSRLAGPPRNLPVPVADIFKNTADTDVYVHVTQCMLSDIQRECGGSLGGRNLQLRLRSLKRLAAQVIEFDRATADKAAGGGTSIKLIEVLWQMYNENAVIYVQFHPVMATWLEHEYTFVNWQIRKHLTDTGKAIHRFLAGQPKHYKIGLQKLCETIGYQRQYKYFVADLKETMHRLEDLNWVTSWVVAGNGRRVRHQLTVQRA